MMQDWRPCSDRDTLIARAQILSSIRDFFMQRGVVEVETPILSHYGVTDPHVHNLQVEYAVPGVASPVPCYLQTSPEYAMKRLLAADMGSIFQICKAFRDDPAGRYHNPEFTMLEWYRAGFGQTELIDEISALLRLVLGVGTVQRCSYQSLFQQHLGFDPLKASVDELQIATEQAGIALTQPLQTVDDYLQLLFSFVIEPNIAQQSPLFVYDFPATQAALARLNPENPLVAQRFELYFKGVELANGYVELTDYSLHDERFKRDQALRQHHQLPERQVDHRFMDAIHSGLPECAGVALGLDRLLMLALQKQSIAEVMSFSIANS